MHSLIHAFLEEFCSIYGICLVSLLQKSVPYVPIIIAYVVGVTLQLTHQRCKAWVCSGFAIIEIWIFIEALNIAREYYVHHLRTLLVLILITSIGYAIGALLKPSRETRPEGTITWAAWCGICLITGILAWGIARVVIPPADHVDVALKWKHQAQFAGFYMAEEYYKNNNLIVRFFEGDSHGSDDPFVKVSKGGSMFGIGDPITLLQEHAEGNRPIALGAIYQISPARWFARIAPDKQGCHKKPELTARDLVGKTVAKSIGRTNVDRELELWIRMNRLQHAVVEIEFIDPWDIPRQKNKLKDLITFVPLRQRSLDSITHFLAGNVDFWIGYASNELEVAREHFGACVVDVKSSLNLYGDILFANAATLDDSSKLETVHRFLSATYEGWRQVSDERNEEAVLDAVMAHISSSERRNARQHQRVMLRILRKNITRVGYTMGEMKKEDWESLAQNLYDTHMLPFKVDSREVSNWLFRPEREKVTLPQSGLAN